MTRWAGSFFWRGILGLACCAMPMTIQAAEPNAADFEFFEKRVRPILAQPLL